MSDSDLWGFEEPIREYPGCADIYDDLPAWIEQDLSPSDVAAILQGGCASGAYMPAVTYHKAAATMAEHGDNVLDYIEESLGELPKPPDGTSWSGMACHYLSAAVELWCSAVEERLESALAEEDEDEDGDE